LVHTPPILLLQRPSASHVLSPAHESGSSIPCTGAHSPLPHAAHGPHAALAQHAPSTQWPVSHAASVVHFSPRDWYSHVSPVVPA
jgi:hypothetical protein